MLERACLGDEVARRWIFERHAPRVARVLARLVGGSAEIADLVQEVFLAGFQRLDRVEDASKLGAWLAGIAVNKAHHARRARRRKWWLSFLPPSDVPPMVSRGAPLEVRETVRATEAVLARLDDEERAVLVLRFIEGMTINEIAVACEVAPATVKRRIQRARGDFVALAREDARLSIWTGGADEPE